MSLRDAIEARLAADAGPELAAQQRLLGEILDALERGGPDDVTARLAQQAAEYRQRGDALLNALRRRLLGAED